MPSENDEQDLLAKEISKLLTNKDISSNERLEKMKELLENKKNNQKNNDIPQPTKQTTYSSADIKKAALRNKILKNK